MARSNVSSCISQRTLPNAYKGREGRRVAWLRLSGSAPLCGRSYLDPPLAAESSILLASAARSLRLVITVLRIPPSFLRKATPAHTGPSPHAPCRPRAAIEERRAGWMATTQVFLSFLFAFYFKAGPFI